MRSNTDAPARSTGLIATLALALTVAACGKKAEPQKAPPPPTVGVAVPLQQSIVDWDDYVGRFEAVKSVEIRPRVSGTLEAIHFKDGDFVYAGQILFTIDPRPYEATLQQTRAAALRARATLANARSQLARGARLLQAQAVAKEEYDTRAATVQTAEADVASTDANVRAAALNVGFTQVRSPVTGRVSDRRADIGNLVGGSGGASPGVTTTGGATTTQTTSLGANTGSGGTSSDGSLLTTVVAVDPIYFTFTASEALYLKYERQNAAGTRTSSRVHPNPVQIRLQDEPEYRIKGHMDFVDNAIDVGSGTIRGRALVPNADHFLTPGMFGRMRLLGSGAYTALLVPDGIVQTDQSRKTVLVVGSDNKAASRVVETGPLINGLRVIRKGLKANDRVIVNGLQMAQAGKPVKAKLEKVVPPEPGTSAQEAAYTTPESSEATAASGGR